MNKNVGEILAIISEVTIHGGRFDGYHWSIGGRTQIRFSRGDLTVQVFVYEDHAEILGEGVAAESARWLTVFDHVCRALEIA